MARVAKHQVTSFASCHNQMWVFLSQVRPEHDGGTCQVAVITSEV